MKIVEFFLIIWGKWSEPEPKLLKAGAAQKWTGSATLFFMLTIFHQALGLEYENQQLHRLIEHLLGIRYLLTNFQLRTIDAWSADYSDSW
jgi:hypothetical protein